MSHYRLNQPGSWRLLFRAANISFALLLYWQTIVPLKAVLFYSTGDPNFNTTAPTGALLDSGWQFQGQWVGTLGTPIASQYFITTEHIGGSVGQTFTLNSVSYTTTAMFDDPNSDLRIWKISGNVPS